jgi:hypothetical protein
MDIWKITCYEGIYKIDDTFVSCFVRLWWLWSNIILENWLGFQFRHMLHSFSHTWFSIKKSNFWKENVKHTTFWDVKLCSLGEVHQPFRGIYCLHLQGWRVSQGIKQQAEWLLLFGYLLAQLTFQPPEDGGSMFVWYITLQGIVLFIVTNFRRKCLGKVVFTCRWPGARNHLYTEIWFSQKQFVRQKIVYRCITYVFSTILHYVHLGYRIYVLWKQ